MQILKVFQYQKIMENKIQKCLIQTNIKNKLLAVIAVNQCVDDNFSKSLKSYLGKDAVYTFINRIVAKSKCCSEVMRKYFNKKLVTTKDDDEDFKNSTRNIDL